MRIVVALAQLRSRHDSPTRTSFSVGNGIVLRRRPIMDFRTWCEVNDFRLPAEGFAKPGKVHFHAAVGASDRGDRAK